MGKHIFATFATLQNAFTAFDADHSGSIDFEELGALFESQALMRQMQS